MKMGKKGKRSTNNGQGGITPLTPDDFHPDVQEGMEILYQGGVDLREICNHASKPPEGNLGDTEGYRHAAARIEAGEIKMNGGPDPTKNPWAWIVSNMGRPFDI